MRFWYVIKDYTEDDFSNEFDLRETYLKNPDHDDVAREIAEQHYYSDPDDPSRFEHTIGVKDETGIIKWFECTAEATVNFYANETEL
jgi:hypothetical protein